MVTKTVNYFQYLCKGSIINQRIKCGELNLARHVQAGQFTKTFRFGEDIFAVRVYGVL